MEAPDQTKELTPKEKWIFQEAAKMVGEVVTPESRLGRLLLRLDRRCGPEGGGLASRQVIAVAVEIAQMLEN
ncbi:MAG: hypothetical protein KQJ78_11170 [Deltaproteobacteria bacterium]|nr:hypothetical protein [Deltaproteobacteria bacterium]